MAAVTIVFSLSMVSSNTLTANETPAMQIAQVEDKKPVPLYFTYQNNELEDLSIEETAEEATTVFFIGEPETSLSCGELLTAQMIEVQTQNEGELKTDGNPTYLPKNILDAEEKIEQQSEEYTDEEKEMIAKVVYAEARGECFDGQVAVAQVVINRYESGRFGNTIKRIVYGRQQFAVSNRYNDSSMEAVEYAIDNMPFPANMYFFQVSKRKLWREFVYYDRIGNHSFYCLKE